MLHTTIIHNEDGTHYIAEICYLKPGSTTTQLLSQFDTTTGKIDLDVLEPFAGSEMVVIHLYREDDEDNYAINTIFNGVEIEPVSGLKSISYTTVEKIEEPKND